MTINTAAVERNHQALQRLLTGLFALAGYALGDAAPATLPRAIRLAILNLLRPAESAVRRLIVVLAREVAVTLPPQRKKGKSKPTQEYHEIPASAFAIDGRSTGIVLKPNTLSRMGPNGRVYLLPKGLPPPPPPPRKRRARRRFSADFILFEPLPSMSRYMRPRRKRSTSIPRIWTLGMERYTPPVRPLPRRDDPMDAASVTHRLAMLARALDDMPAQARRLATRLARRARIDAEHRARGKPPPIGRSSPLRLGRMPGGRLTHYDPDRPRAPNIREIDEVLAHCNSMALYPPRRDSS